MNNLYDFIISDEEYQLIIDIIDNHECENEEIGGLWSYIFTPTVMGNFMYLKCNKCLHEWNITEEARDEYE